MDATELKAELLELKRRKERYKELDRLAKDARKDHDMFQARLHAMMEEHGLQSVKLEGHSYVSKTTLFANVRDLEAFRAWCRDNQVEDVFLSETEEKQRVNEFIRECIDTNRELPDGVVVIPRQYISITESK